MRSRLLEYLEASTEPSVIYAPEDPVPVEETSEPVEPTVPNPQKKILSDKLDKVGDFQLDKSMPRNDLLRQKRHWNIMAENLKSQYPNLGGQRGNQL